MFKKIFFIRTTFSSVFISLKIMAVGDAQLSKPWTALRNRLDVSFFLPTGSKEHPVISAIC